MKNLKFVIAAILIYSGTFISGCSDNITAPEMLTAGAGQQLSPGKNYNVKLNNELRIDSSIHRIISLRPYQTYSFNYQNTGLRIFHSISAPNCDALENIIEIRGYADDGEIFIECGNNNFTVFEINVRNLTPGFVDLDLTLTGSRRLISFIHQIEH